MGHSAKRELGDRFRVVVWDLPDLGRSKPLAGGKIALANFAADFPLAGVDITAASSCDIHAVATGS